MRALVYQCPAGISGDMNLGALVDLGVEPAALNAELEKLGLPGWTLRFERDARQGISGTRCDVALETGGSAHHHATEDGHGHHHHHHHDHRTFSDIRRMIEASGLGERVKRDAVAVFRALAEAEGAVHGKPAEEVHFHEVGAVDSIVDIVGAAVCWDLLEIDEIHASAIELGGGTVDCAHGRMPVPAPATARLVADMPVTLKASDHETTTPTGAALLAGGNCRFGEPVAGRQVANGTGVGQRDDPRLANVLHVMLIESGEADADAGETVVEIATNIDDMSAEHLAHLCERLFDAGALDVWQQPATFKKGRLGTVVTALAPPDRATAVEDRLLAESTTLGLRRREWRRRVLPREEKTVDTAFGPVRVKAAHDASGAPSRIKPEFDDCRAIAIREGMPIAEVTERIRRELEST